jgi:hypothetical protein
MQNIAYSTFGLLSFIRIADSTEVTDYESASETKRKEKTSLKREENNQKSNPQAQGGDRRRFLGSWACLGTIWDFEGAGKHGR